MGVDENQNLHPRVRLRRAIGRPLSCLIEIPAKLYELYRSNYTWECLYGV